MIFTLGKSRYPFYQPMIFNLQATMHVVSHGNQQDT